VESVNLQFLLMILIVLLICATTKHPGKIRIMIMSRKKPELLSQPGLLNYYPANAVKADIPFPFGNGRMTTAWSSDFQLRHVIFPMQPSLLKLMKYRFGNHTCNLEHRRVNWSKVLG